MSNKNPTYRITRRADQQGVCSPVRNQGGVEKLDAGTNLPTNTSLVGKQNREKPNLGPLNLSTTQNKHKRIKRTKEEYKGVMRAFFMAKHAPSRRNNSSRTYEIWITANPDKRPNLDPNKLANVRRDIVSNHRLIMTELSEIENMFATTENNNNKQPKVVLKSLTQAEIQSAINNISEGRPPNIINNLNINNNNLNNNNNNNFIFSLSPKLYKK